MKTAARYQGVEKQSSGFKLLAAMGWREGEGLGANRQGMKEHVKVRRMQDKVGIGLAQATKKSRDWTIGMAAYDQVLAKLSTVGASGPQAATKKRNQPEAGPAEGKAEVQRKTKKKRISKSNGAQEPSLDAAAHSSAEASVQAEVLASADAAAAPVASPSAEALSRSSHLARFGRRRAGKNVRSYSGSDLAAILGGGGGPVAAPEAEEQAAPTALPVITEQAAPEGAMDEYPSHLEEAAGEQEADAGQQRWWHRYFVPAGRLGSKAADCQQTRPADAAPVKVKVAGFSEDDQAALYNLTQSGKTAGKQGLGIGKGPKKVAGARWQGTKIRLGEDSDAEQEEAAGQQQRGNEGAGSEGSEDTHVSSHGAGEEAAQVDPESAEPAAVEARTERQQQAGEAAASEGPAVKGSLLKKLAVSVLQAAGGQLRTKKLEKRVLDAAGLPRGGSVRREARRRLRLALQKPRFSMLGDETMLVS